MYPETSYNPAPTAYPAPTPGTSRWKVWLGLLILLVIALIVAFLVAYTSIVPSRQVSHYIADVKTHQPVLSAKMEKLSDTVLKSESLTSPTADPEQTEKDAKAGSAALTAALAELDTTKKQVTSFSPLPLSSWNDRYKAAEVLRTKENDYITKSEAYIKDMAEVVTFLDKTAKLGKTVTAGQDDLTLDKLASEGLPVYGKHLSETIQAIEPAFEAYQKFKVPPSLKKIYDYDIFITKQIIAALKKQAAAAQANDQAGYISAVIDTAEIDYNALPTMEEYINDFSKNSTLKKSDTTLRDLDENITADIKKF
jgi:hypothetical protein